jgi:hypothetical protein
MAHAIWMYSACAAMLLPASGVRAILPDLMINRLPGLENDLTISVKDCNNLSPHFNLIIIGPVLAIRSEIHRH